MRAFVADDDPQVRRLVERFLSVSGYETRTFADGRSLLVGALDGRPDLIVSDIDMPGAIDGLRACAAVRALWPNTRSIMMSGDPLRIERARAQGLAVLSKPFGLAEFRRALEG